MALYHYFVVVDPLMSNKSINPLVLNLEWVTIYYVIYNRYKGSVHNLGKPNSQLNFTADSLSPMLQ